MNALAKLKDITGRLVLSGIESADREAEIIVREAVGIDLVRLYRDNPELNNEDMKKIEIIVERRSVREPLQYILGHTDFLGMRIEVGRGVLIPRPETEFMAEHATRMCSSRIPEPGPLTILDLCTGSGCIALVLARTFPGSAVYATDLSESAITCATGNAQMNNIKNVMFYQGNLYTALPADRRFDLITSNPPYIRTGEIESLQSEIKNWEPLNALDGGDDGLFYYRKIISDSPGFINNGGMLILEIGDDQAMDVLDMMSRAGYSGIEITRDLAGKDRIVQGQWIK